MQHNRTLALSAGLAIAGLAAITAVTSTPAGPEFDTQLLGLSDEIRIPHHGIECPAQRGDAVGGHVGCRQKEFTDFRRARYGGKEGAMFIGTREFNRRRDIRQFRMAAKRVLHHDIDLTLFDPIRMDGLEHVIG